MITQAIIAEYNPFHNGHKYHLEQSTKATNADYTISLMGGNFLQRGDIAMWNKYLRAAMACSSGIDLVLELPFPYATGSALDFASGAINILDKLSCIDYLCFGAESNNIDAFNYIVDILLNEPEEYKLILKNYLSSGLSFPASRQKALVDYSKSEEIINIIKEPNNILAIEYLSALKRINSNIKPIIIKREHSRYHATEIEGNICSATAIRNIINNTDVNTELLNIVPAGTRELILKDYQKHSPLDNEQLTPFIQAKLIGEAIDTNICDLSEGVYNRLLKSKYNKGYNALIDEIKSKNITESRIKRSIIHMLLNYTEADRKQYINNGFAFYANILSFKKNSSLLIKHIKDRSLIPLITKKADAINIFDSLYNQQKSCANSMWSLDMKASALYSCLVYNKYKTELSDDYSVQLPIL